MIKSSMQAACLCLMVVSSGARAEGQALSANGGASGGTPARVGAGNQLPDAKTSYARPLTTPSSGEGAKLPTDGAADRPNDQAN